MRKLRDILHAPILHRALTRDGEEELASWYATHAAFTRSDLHGLAMAAWMLFGKQPAELNIGEQALLAASAAYRIPVSGGADPSGPRRTALARRALDAVADRGLIDPRQHAEALVQLEEVSLGARSRSSVDPCLGGSVSDILQVRLLRPDSYAARHARTQLVQARTELQERARGQAGWWNDLSAIRLTTDVHADCAVAGLVEQEWSALGEHLPSLRDHAWYVVALAGTDGAIRHLASNSEAPWYAGPARPGGDARIGAVAPREIGSVGKILAAILLARAGDSPASLYEVAPRERRGSGAYHNYGGHTGERGTFITARMAFATSNNLALMGRLDREDVSTDDLQELLEGFGFRICQPGRSPKNRDDLLEAIVLGTACGTPRDLHRLVQSVALSIVGADVDPTACTPRIVSKVQRVGSDDWEPVAEPWAGCPRLVSNLLQEPREIAYLRSVLSAVVEPGGSAHRALGRLEASVHPRIDLHIAKTGTVGAAGQGTQLANAVGAVVIDGRLYSYVVQVGPLAPGGALDRRLGGGTAARLVAPLIERLLLGNNP